MTNVENIYDKTVCSQCAGNSLGKYVSIHGSNDICSYCSKANVKTISVENAYNRILKSSELFFSNSDDSSFSEEFRNLYDFSDIIDDSDMKLEDANESFLKDLKQIPDDRCWQKDSEYWMPAQNALIDSWERFSSIVKYEWRYTFFMDKELGITEDPALYNFGDMMKIILEIIESQKETFITTLPTKSKIFRTRKFNTPQEITANDLGTSPKEKASENRFSPKGIPLFYGSEDKETSVQESTGQGIFIITGEFYNAQEIKILDLTNLPKIPDLYDDNYTFIPVIQFLHNFSDAITKDVSFDSKLDYIPTQIFTEYIRRRFNVKGIKYKSSKVKNGENFVLFYKNEECKDSDDGTNCLVLHEIFKRDFSSKNCKIKKE